MFFFFQAEDGIRDDLVTGVQTCALPIYFASRRLPHRAQLNVGERLQLASRGLRALLDAADVRREALVRLAERGLSIEAALASLGDEIEQQLAEEFRIVDVERQLDARRAAPHARGA